MGAARCDARLARVAVIAAAVFCLADWVLVEDLGFLGGLGTDPNNMIPLILLFTVGSLGLTPAPQASTAEVTATSGALAAETPDPAIERGHKQFEQACGFCHGSDATGTRGPDLVRSTLVAHDVNPLLPYIDRVVYLAGGRTLQGTVDEVITSKALSAMYGVGVEVLRASDGRLVVVGAARLALGELQAAADRVDAVRVDAAAEQAVAEVAGGADSQRVDGLGQDMDTIETNLHAHIDGFYSLNPAFTAADACMPDE